MCLIIIVVEDKSPATLIIYYIFGIWFQEMTQFYFFHTLKTWLQADTVVFTVNELQNVCRCPQPTLGLPYRSMTVLVAKVTDADIVSLCSASPRRPCLHCFARMFCSWSNQVHAPKPNVHLHPLASLVVPHMLPLSNSTLDLRAYPSRWILSLFSLPPVLVLFMSLCSSSDLSQLHTMPFHVSSWGTLFHTQSHWNTGLLGHLHLQRIKMLWHHCPPSLRISFSLSAPFINSMLKINLI